MICPLFCFSEQSWTTTTRMRTPSPRSCQQCLMAWSWQRWRRCSMSSSAAWTSRAPRRRQTSPTRTRHSTASCSSPALSWPKSESSVLCRSHGHRGATVAEGMTIVWCSAICCQSFWLRGTSCTGSVTSSVVMPVAWTAYTSCFLLWFFFFIGLIIYLENGMLGKIWSSKWSGCAGVNNFLVYKITSAVFLIDYLSCGVVIPWSDCRMFLWERLSQTCAYITSCHEPIAFQR